MASIYNTIIVAARSVQEFVVCQFDVFFTMADFTSMSSQDLGLWLQEQGIPSEFCEKFEGAYLLVLAHKVTIRASYNKDDNIAVQRNRDELAKELRQDKPRKEIILSLARQTFQVRRTSVVSKAEDVSVTSLFSENCPTNMWYVMHFSIVYLLLWFISNAI